MPTCMNAPTPQQRKENISFSTHHNSTLTKIFSHFTTMITIPTTTTTFKSRYFSLKWCQRIPTREGNEHLIPGKYTVNKKMILYFVHSLHRVPLAEWSSSGNIITATTKNCVQQQPTKQGRFLCQHTAGMEHKTFSVIRSDWALYFPKGSATVPLFLLAASFQKNLYYYYDHNSVLLSTNARLIYEYF